MAYGVMESLTYNHIESGSRVSVIVHNNLYFSHIPSNSLTTMALAKEQIAETAIQYAKELMAYRMDSNLQKPICKCKIPNKLVIRDSTGPYIG